MKKKKREPYVERRRPKGLWTLLQRSEKRVLLGCFALRYSVLLTGSETKAVTLLRLEELYSLSHAKLCILLNTTKSLLIKQSIFFSTSKYATVTWKEGSLENKLAVFVTSVILERHSPNQWSRKRTAFRPRVAFRKFSKEIIKISLILF